MGRELFREDHPEGKIERPARAETVPAGSIATGSLTDIPGDAHVWLVARHGGQVWPVGSELGHEPSWERRIPVVLPRGQALSLALLVVGDEASDELRSRVGRISTLPVGALGDYDELAAVPRFFVGVESEGSRLYAVFPQAGEAEAEAFRYENGDGLVNAELPDDPSCHRPSRSTGLRLEWRMSGEQSGGWGVAWDRTDVGSFDASGFDHLSLSVKGEVGGETFQLALKDTAHEEQRVESTDLGDVTANGWGELSAPLTEFAPVDLSSLETLSIGFSQPNGSGEICIDEIEFGGTAPAGSGVGSTAGQAGGEPPGPASREETEELERTEGPEVPPQGPVTLFGAGTQGGTAMSRSNASEDSTILLETGKSAVQEFETTKEASFRIGVRYTNDNYGPLELVRLGIDGSPVGEFEARDTGDWNRLAAAASLGPVTLPSGSHQIRISVSGGDGYGVEIDRVLLTPEG